jgi:hypothetical protein
MCDLQNTSVCAFDPSSPRVSAFQIHDWIYEHLKLPEEDVRMIQIDGPWRCVYIKFHSCERTLAVLQKTSGGVEFRHGNGEMSVVRTELAGIGIRRILLANLPPEVLDRVIRQALPSYGYVKEVQEKSQSRAYRYKAYNGIRIAVTELNKHLPSHKVIAGTRVLVTYEGQPPTYYGCIALDHQYRDFPAAKR